MSDGGDPTDRDRNPDRQHRADPYRRHRFTVTVDGLPTLGVTEVRGLEVTVDSTPEEPTDDRRGDRGRARGFVGRFIGRHARSERYETTSPSLELRRGVTDDPVLWNWLQAWVGGQIEPRSVRVSLLDESDEPAVGWVCQEATPVEWTGPRLRADSPGVAMERLELTHEGIRATTGTSGSTTNPLEARSRPSSPRDH